MRIEDYAFDSSVTLNDFVIGSDAEGNNKTKNYRFRDYAKLLFDKYSQAVFFDGVYIERNLATLNDLSSLPSNKDFVFLSNAFDNKNYLVFKKGGSKSVLDIDLQNLRIKALDTELSDDLKQIVAYTDESSTQATSTFTTEFQYIELVNSARTAFVVNNTELSVVLFRERDKNGIADAPSNGQTFARQNGNWVVVTTGGGGSGIADAPTDGRLYLRGLNDWQLYTDNSLPDAPNDGKSYVRKDQTWEENTLVVDSFVFNDIDTVPSSKALSSVNGFTEFNDFQQIKYSVTYKSFDFIDPLNLPPLNGITTPFIVLEEATGTRRYLVFNNTIANQQDFDIRFLRFKVVREINGTTQAIEGYTESVTGTTTNPAGFNSAEISNYNKSGTSLFIDGDICTIQFVRENTAESTGTGTGSDVGYKMSQVKNFTQTVDGVRLIMLYYESENIVNGVVAVSGVHTGTSIASVTFGNLPTSAVPDTDSFIVALDPTGSVVRRVNVSSSVSNPGSVSMNIGTIGADYSGLNQLRGSFSYTKTR